MEMNSGVGPLTVEHEDWLRLMDASLSALIPEAFICLALTNSDVLTKYIHNELARTVQIM